MLIIRLISSNIELKISLFPVFYEELALKDPEETMVTEENPGPFLTIFF
jgi:hypothetical protein